MSTFNATDLNQFTLEISDRDIYNDIRSETDVTTETEVQGDGTPEEHSQIEVPKDGNVKVVLAANSSENVVFTALDGHADVTWLEAEVVYATRTREYDISEVDCEADDGTWFAAGDTYPSCCYYPDIAGTLGVLSMIRTKTTWTVKITNPHDYEVRAKPQAIYSYLSQEAIEGAVTIHTHTRTLTIRSTDATSIKKYGRRVMNLVWPMGQSEEQAQSLIDAYCDRYSEPVPFASAVIEGSTDARITQILDMDIDDKHTFIHPRLDMNQAFFVNNISITLNREGTGLLTGTFGLEQVRTMEEDIYFIINTSEIGGTHVIAP